MCSMWNFQAHAYYYQMFWMPRVHLQHYLRKEALQDLQHQSGRSSCVRGLRRNSTAIPKGTMLPLFPTRVPEQEHRARQEAWKEAKGQGKRRDR